MVSKSKAVSRRRRVNIDDVLEAREKRTLLQAEFRSRYNSPVISITVNMPGSIKYTDDTVSLVYTATDRLRMRIREEGLTLLEERICHVCTGPTAVMAVTGDARRIKAVSVQIEEESGFGRLLDIDVYDREGLQISRAVMGLPARKCLVCPEPAVDCMRTQRHDSEDIARAVQTLLDCKKVADVTPWPMEVQTIGSIALEAMLLEAVCTPAPGLVDRFNSGAHRDMDLVLFMRSSSALAPALYRCALAAWTHTGSSDGLLPILRSIGVAAEAEMYEVTGGVNTQKGLLFLMGVVVAAATRASREKRQDNIPDATLREVASLCSGIVERELGVLKRQIPDRKLTAGERLYLAFGTTGIRGEVEAGLPIVVRRGLTGLREALLFGLNLNDALVHTLICLMTETEDTTVLSRHGMQVLQEVQDDAAEILEKGGMTTDEGRQRIEALDRKYIERGISPGGSADLLAATYFLHRIEKKFPQK